MQANRATLGLTTLLLLAGTGAAELPFASMNLDAGPVPGPDDPAALLRQDAATGTGEGPSGLELAEGLLLPGLWQARHGQWLKAGVFFTIEAGVLLLANKWNQDGQDLDKTFRAYADTHWDYGRYITWRLEPGEFALEEGWLDRGFTNLELEGLSEGEILAFYGNTADDVFFPNGGAGSHVLPGSYQDGFGERENGAWDHYIVLRTQQFYEMIGKYAQFQRGWDDFGVDQDAGFEFPLAQGDWRGINYYSPNSRRYIAMRTDSNDKLIAADRIMGLLLVNHVASFMDVLVQSRRGSLEFGSRSINTSTNPVAALSLSWSF